MMMLSCEDTSEGVRMFVLTLEGCCEREVRSYWITCVRCKGRTISRQVCGSMYIMGPWSSIGMVCLE